MNNNQNTLIYFLNKCWRKETCYPSMQNLWSEKNKALGQCAVTSLIVNDYLGGDIFKCNINGVSHYFNIINDEIVDLTKNQFNTEKLEYMDLKKKERENILSNIDTKNRYELLKSGLDKYLDDLNKLNLDINKCYECEGIVEKFDNHNTVYIGKNPRILLLGEAPANNGWRKSGMLWKDMDGKILPSGVIFQRLLDTVELNLFDLSFTEAVKCYPKERKSLRCCNANCNVFLLKQLEVLKPEIIISLGDYATKGILNFKYKNFSEVVGKVFEIEIGNRAVKIIPIYHPSPISPMSYKGNLPIFEKLKKMLS